MYKVITICIATSMFLLMGCGNKEGEGKEDYVLNPIIEDTADSKEPFYPFIDYVNSQLAYIDSTPFGIEKIVSINGKTIDSSFTTKAELKALATLFTEIDPNSLELKPSYREGSFNDLTLNRLTFSIEAIDKNLPLQQADVFMNPDNQMVKNIVLRKQFQDGDSSVMQHLVWVDKMHFQISESITKTDNKMYNKVIRIVWDKPLE